MDHSDTKNINVENDEAKSQRNLDVDGQVWARLASAENVDEFCQSWLAIQCRQITGVYGGLVLLGPIGLGPFKPVAVWPDLSNDMRHLSKVAEQALVERRGLLEKSSPPDDGSSSSNDHYHIAYPLELQGKLFGVVVLDVSSQPEAELQLALRQLHWGSAWLEILMRRQSTSDEGQVLAQRITSLDMMSEIVGQENFYASAMAFVTELATRLECTRVSIGFKKMRRVVVSAMSHNAQFNDKSNLARSIGSAMDEAYDQSNTIVFPALTDGKIPFVSKAHEELTEQSDSESICSVPVVNHGEIVGVLTLERGKGLPFDQHEVDMIESVAGLVGPVLIEKKENDRWLITKVFESSGKILKKIFGPRNVAMKLAIIALIAVSLFFFYTETDFRISANTVIEGKVQQVIASPFEAYIAESDMRAGELVKKGQVLAVLDDKDLVLEQLNLRGQKQQLSSQYREAMAKHDRAQIRIATAKMHQVNAQLDLVEYKLSRTKLSAPFDGVIVSGDLSQSLGAPVEKGQVLFEVAPLDAYRIILQVDERDIGHIKSDQVGTLVLSSYPDEEFSFNVEMVTPVSLAKDGRNYFRVEAKMDTLSRHFRPGMEGVGKINISQENIFWIWTYKIVDWFRLWLWSMLP